MPIELNGIQREFPKLAHPSCSGLPNLLVFEGDDPEIKPNEQTKTTASESRIKSPRRQRGDGEPTRSSISPRIHWLQKRGHFKVIIEEWRLFYNRVHPHSKLWLPKSGSIYQEKFKT